MCKRYFTRAFILCCLLAVLGGCASQQAFHNYARAGDTIAISAGCVKDLVRANLGVEFQQEVGGPISYAPGAADTPLRVVSHFYPDPISSLRASLMTDQNLTPFSRTYAMTTNNNECAGDSDWSNTVIFIDLPSALQVGATTVSILDGLGNEVASSDFTIIAGQGSPNPLQTKTVGNLTPDMLRALERVPHYTVTFTGATVPHAIEVMMAHDPDADNGGVGRLHAANPTADVKTLIWHDDGQSFRGLLMLNNTAMSAQMKDFKIYVAGGIANLSLSSVSAYDINGNPVPGVVASIQASN